MTIQEFKVFLRNGTVLLDGATGTNLFAAGMPRGVSPEGWILEHPQVMKDLQKAYIRAGSQIIYAPTFGANRNVLSGYGLDGNLEDINERLVDLSKQAVKEVREDPENEELSGKQILIAGDLSPTGLLTEDMGGEATDDDLFEIYKEQVSCLLHAGVDLLVFETMMSVEEVTVGFDAARAVCDLPIMCSMTVNADGRAFLGGTIDEAVETLTEMGADAVGVNCCSGPDQLENIISRISRLTDLPVIAKPNAGIPVVDNTGRTVYDMGAARFAEYMKKLVEAGASMIGGCCGTTPEYIRRCKAMLNGETLIRRNFKAE